MPRLVQLVGSCIVLGVGVGMLLTAALGSDGYSTLINGIAIAFGLPFVGVNCAVGALLVALAWWRGVRPGWGTITQPVVVGLVVNAALETLAKPDAWAARGVLLLAAFPVLVVGVAGYLGSGLGAGPTEAAALAFDPPVPFRWSYSVLQGGGALAGWLLGAAIGPGTLLVIFGLGPAVHAASQRIAALDIHAAPDQPELSREPGT